MPTPPVETRRIAEHVRLTCARRRHGTMTVRRITIRTHTVARPRRTHARTHGRIPVIMRAHTRARARTYGLTQKPTIRRVQCIACLRVRVPVYLLFARQPPPTRYFIVTRLGARVRRPPATPPTTSYEDNIHTVFDLRNKPTFFFFLSKQNRVSVRRIVFS